MPANPGNQFQRKWTDEDYAHAINRVLKDGLTIQHVSDETTIPYETLRKAVSAHVIHNAPELPEDNPGQHMAQQALETLHVALYRHTNPVSRRSGKTDVKALKDIGEAVKLWTAIHRENKPLKPQGQPKSALEALNGRKTAA